MAPEFANLRGLCPPRKAPYAYRAYAPRLKTRRNRYAQRRIQSNSRLFATAIVCSLEGMSTKPIDEITGGIIGCAIAVHDVFGPGLFEATYIPPFVWELQDRGLQCEPRIPLDIAYRGRRLRNAYWIDILVEDLVVVEVKAVERLAPVHLAQLITYVRLAGKPAGLLINFNEKRLVDGVRRVLNDRAARKPQATTVRRDREER